MAPIAILQSALNVSIIVLHDFMLLLLCLLMVLMSCRRLLLRPLLLHGLAALVLLIVLFLRVADPVLVGWRAIRSPPPIPLPPVGPS